MKTTFLSIILCLFFLMSAITVNGQDTIARFKYADAEKAFTNKNYTQAITLLNETEALLGKPAPNVTHLRIMAMNEQIKIDYPETFEEMQKFFDDVEFYLANFDIEGLEDKYRDVYEIQKSLSIYPKLEKDFFATKGFRARYNSKNEQQALRWYEKAANLGHTGAQMQLALAYKTGTHLTQDDKKAFEWYKKAAEAGDAKAQNTLATLLEAGTGVDKDMAQALNWYQKSAAAGNEYAQYNLGLYYEFGKGGEKNETEAFNLYKKAADKESTNAKYRLGLLYASGRGVPQSDEKAFEWYKKAAESGNVYAQTKLATLYNTGTGVAQNKTEATNWYKKAAEGDGLPNINAKKAWARALYTGEGGEKNYAEALKLYLQIYAKSEDNALRMAIGKIYAEGGYGITKDSEEALKWFKEVAILQEDGSRGFQYVQAAYSIANAYLLQQKCSEAIEWYKKATDQSKDYAYDVGLCNYRINNFSEAVTWYKMLTNNKEMFNMVGDAYEKLGNYDEAIEWYTTGTDSGSVYAPYSLGLLYYEGKGVKKNDELALQWIQKSPHPFAKLGVAMMYYAGRGVKKDRDKAVELCEILAEETQAISAYYKGFKEQIQEGADTQKYYPRFSGDIADFFAYLDENNPEMFK